MQAKRRLCNDLLHKCLMMVTRTGISDTPQAETSRRVSAINCLARTDVFFIIPVRVTKSKIPKPNAVRFRNLLVTRTGLEALS